ncbi:MAG: cation transporter [Candidatus Scalindua sp.]|nr:cation transporter [Candidatus Scalindua sp.]MCR4344705.1 cation transporter [Candidatus Scalindua sp.]
MLNCGCEIEIKSREESRVLIILLSINAAMFIMEFTFGCLSESTGLIADSLDMLADALVYGAGLYAVGKSLRIKANSAMLSGCLQMTLGIGVLLDIIRRTIMGSKPDSVFMIYVSVVALIANVICLVLLSKHRDGEVHMRATWIFTKNDVIANLGVITAGVLVAYFSSAIPDLIIGCIISAIIIRGSVQIIREAKEARSSQLTIK